MLGRDVGKLGSVGDFGLVTGESSVPDWQLDSSAPVASTQARKSRAVIGG
jgi:hypothetical protein